MTISESKGRDLFIVDNSVSGWTGLRYLEEWSGIAKAFDIATGYFEIGALLALDGKWQPLDKIRILMGAETTHRTRKALLEAVRDARARDPRRQHRGRQGRKPLPARRSGDPRGAALRPDRVPRLRQGQVPRQGLHHARQARSRRLAGAGRLEQLHGAWPDQEHRAQHPGPERPRGRAAPGVVRDALERSDRGHRRGHRDRSSATRDLYTPFDVYAKALQEFFRGHELTATEWDETRSKMFPQHRPLSEGGLLGADEDRAPARRRVPLRRRRSRQDLRRPDADRAARAARGQARRAVRAEGDQGRRLGAAPARVAAAHRRRRRRCGLQQPRRLQPHRPRSQGRLPGALPAHRRAGRRRDHRRGAPLPQSGSAGRRGRGASNRRATTSSTTCSTTRCGRRRSSCSRPRRSTTG